MHAEDEARFNAMQKMAMSIKPKILKSTQVGSVRLSLWIKGRPLCAEIGLKSLLEAIENKVFKSLNWQRLGGDHNVLVKQYQRSYGRGVKVDYLFNSIIELKKLKLLIDEEAVFRLFDCRVVE